MNLQVESTYHLDKRSTKDQSSRWYFLQFIYQGKETNLKNIIDENPIRDGDLQGHPQKLDISIGLFHNNYVGISYNRQKVSDQPELTKEILQRFDDFTSTHGSIITENPVCKGNPGCIRTQWGIYADNVQKELFDISDYFLNSKFKDLFLSILENKI